MDPYADVHELRAERRRLVTRIESLHDRARGAPLEGEQAAEWNRLNGEVDEIDAAIGQEQIRMKRLEELAEHPGAVQPGGQFPMTGDGSRDRALRLIERAHSNESEIGTRLSDEDAASPSRLVRNDPGGQLSEQLTAQADPAYASWWDKRLRYGDSAGAHTTLDEIKARERVEMVERALGVTTGSAGGFLLPFDLDPTINLSSAGAINPLREISRVERTTVNEWRGVTSAGATASFDPEATEVSDDTPILAQPVVVLDKAQFFVPFSIELDMDSASIRRELANVATDAKNTLEAEKFLVGAGHGSNEPSGVLASPAPATVSTTIAALSGGLTSAIEALPNRFRTRASWLMGLNTINRVALLETTNGARLFPSIDADRLLGKPVYEHSGVAGGTASGGTLAVVGDFNQYLIVDRVGFTVEVVQHLFGNANRPTGQRGFYGYWRTGGTALIQGAFRQLKVT